MKSLPFFSAIALLFFFASCVAPADSDKNAAADPIEMTLTSVSLIDSTDGVTEADIAGALENINTAITEIGFPGAGYSFWKVQNDSLPQYRFMVQGSWPDQAAYDKIHEHELYKTATEKAEALVGPLVRNATYRRFQRVK